MRELLLWQKVAEGQEARASVLPSAGPHLQSTWGGGRGEVVLLPSTVGEPDVSVIGTTATPLPSRNSHHIIGSRVAMCRSSNTPCDGCEKLPGGIEPTLTTSCAGTT